MTESKETLLFAARRLPAHADEIVRQWNHPDIREICEHLELICRVDHQDEESTKVRFFELQAELEDELIALLQLNQERSTTTKEN